jgi:hypothetical protein
MVAISHNDIEERLASLPGQPVAGIAHRGDFDEEPILPDPTDALYAEAMLHVDQLFDSMHESWREVSKRYESGNYRRASLACQSLRDEFVHAGAVCEDLFTALRRRAELAPSLYARGAALQARGAA